MFIPEKPYVSDLLWDTVVKLQIPVLEKELAPKYVKSGLNTLSKNAFIQRYKDTDSLLYINSENAVEWIDRNLEFSGLPQKLKGIKDKHLFRELTRELAPDLYFSKLNYTDLKDADTSKIPFPVILKPSVGFNSLAVFRLNNAQDFTEAIAKIDFEFEKYGSAFPKEVVDIQQFILEEVIEGDEYAFDMYYDALGEVTILMVLQHIFESPEDMSDRLYLTSKQIITETGSKFKAPMEFIGKKMGFRNVAMHAEFRITPQGKVLPIEVNPMRFAGYCTTDISHYAFGFNGYEYLFQQKKPNWDTIFEGKEDKVYGLSVIDVRPHVMPHDIKSYDYGKLLEQFERPLHIRKFDYKTYPVFGFVFAEITGEQEMQRILKMTPETYATY